MKLDRESVESALIDYVISRSLVYSGKMEDFPLHTSLTEAGILDSYEMVELIQFIETNWKISFDPAEFTREKMGSIHKLCQLTQLKASGLK